MDAPARVSLYAGDIGDAHPALYPACPSPLHGVALPMMDLPLIEQAVPAAAVAGERGVPAVLGGCRAGTRRHSVKYGCGSPVPQAVLMGGCRYDA
jgi:hypothetical protein